MLPPLQSRGKCTGKHKSVCTYNAYFHFFLAQMGHTALSTRHETDLLRHYNVDTLEPLPYEPFPVLNPPLTHQIFLYDPNQIDGQKSPEIAEQFRVDLSDWLGLDTPLPSLAAAQPKPHNANATAVEVDPGRQEGKMVGTIIDICDSEFKPLRDELILIGRDTAKWIIEFFLPLEHVHVSSPDFILEVLDGYKVDPCEEHHS